MCQQNQWTKLCRKKRSISRKFTFKSQLFTNEQLYSMDLCAYNVGTEISSYIYLKDNFYIIVTRTVALYSEWKENSAIIWLCGPKSILKKQRRVGILTLDVVGFTRHHYGRGTRWRVYEISLYHFWQLHVSLWWLQVKS